MVCIAFMRTESFQNKNSEKRQFSVVFMPYCDTFLLFALKEFQPRREGWVLMRQGIVATCPSHANLAFATTATHFPPPENRSSKNVIHCAVLTACNQAKKQKCLWPIHQCLPNPLLKQMIVEPFPLPHIPSLPHLPNPSSSPSPLSDLSLPRPPPALISTGQDSGKNNMPGPKQSQQPSESSAAPCLI